mgnify:CR=1 FL=1
MSCSAVLPRICTSREVKNSCLPLQGAVLAPKILFLAIQRARSLAGQRRASPLLLASPAAPRPVTPRAVQPQRVTALSVPRVPRVMTVHLSATGPVPRGTRVPRDSTALREAHAHGLVIADQVSVTTDLSFICMAQRKQELPISTALSLMQSLWQR